jgi:hypothetical protein
MRTEPTSLLSPGPFFQKHTKNSKFSSPWSINTGPLKFPVLAMDKDRTVSRRSEPSSHIALMGEQPNPWNLLQLQDAMSLLSPG